MLDILKALGENEMVVKVVAPIFLLGFLIFVHESGHFLFAKLFGVGVEKFSFGFGPRIFGFTRNGTEYRLSWIPLGGYVKMVGDDPFDDLSTEDRDDSFLQKPVWQRLLVVFAGPLFNLLLPIVLFAGIYLVGSPEPISRVGVILPGSAADAAGLQDGDRVVAVGDRQVQFYDDLQDALLELPLGATTPLTVSRDGQTRTVPVTLQVEPGVNRWGQSTDQNVLGIDPNSARPVVGVPAGSSAAAAGLKSGDLLVSIDGKPIDWWYQVEEVLTRISGATGVVSEPDGQEGRPVSLKVTVRRGEETLEVQVPPGPLDYLTVMAGKIDPGATVPPVGKLFEAYPGARYGFLPQELFIREVVPGKPAERAGLLAGDLIVAINGQVVEQWLDIKRLIEAPADQVKNILVLREGGLRFFAVQPDVVTIRDAFGRAHQEGRISIMPAAMYATEKETLRLGAIEAVGRGTLETASIIYMSAKLLGQVMTGDIPLTESLGGPIAIVTVAARSAWVSIFEYVRMMVLISVSLGLINLLPIPLLDGGHILFFTLELVRGRPVSMRFREVSQQVGLIILFILMAFAMANDVRMTLLR